MTDTLWEDVVGWIPTYPPLGTHRGRVSLALLQCPAHDLHGSREKVPTTNVCRPGWPAARNANSLERDRDRPSRPCVSVHRRAGRRENHLGQAGRQSPQLPGQRSVTQSVQHLRRVSRDHRRRGPRRPRNGRSLEQQRGGRATAAGVHSLSAEPRSIQDRHRRRGPHALDGSVQRLSEDARGASFAREVHLRDYRKP